jgi:EpsI family protein
MMEFLKTTPVRILTGILLLQSTAYYVIASRGERIPAVDPLSAFPQVSNGWTVEREFPLEKEVAEVLKADDTLNRLYVNPQRTTSASLFIAFFKTQRYGQSPHSPKNCLPGSGWEPTEDSTVSVVVPGRELPINIHKYVIVHGKDESVVLYWYQSHSRVIAGEFSAKFWLVADAIRYHRSDTALVRVIAPVFNGDRNRAEKTAVEFTQAVYPDVARQLPH